MSFILREAYVPSCRNRVEVAYREAVALRRQEELIREEEAAGQAETELRAKREAAEKEKRSKKKQVKSSCHRWTFLMLFYIILCILCESSLLMNVMINNLLLLNSVNISDDVICEFLTL